MKIKAIQHIRISTLGGSGYSMEKDEIADVPPTFVNLVLAAGGAPVLEDGTTGVSSLEDAEKAAAIRKEALSKAVSELVNEGDPKKFSDQGVPRPWAVQEKVGFLPSVPEIEAVLEELTGGHES